jgi:uncharacterized protein (DUF58 family)
MPRLTRTGTIGLAVCLALYVAARTSQSSLLLMLIGLLLGCYIVNYIYGKQTLAAIDLEIPELTQLREGDPAARPWKVMNRQSRPSGWGTVEAPDGCRLRFPGLPSSGLAHLVPVLPFRRRGVYEHRDLCLETTYPFGLWRVRRPLQLTGEVMVYPATYEVPPPQAAGYDLMVGGKHQGAQATTAGAHFAGVRPMQPGDPFKQVHWKSSAKGLGWMVKVHEEELAGRVAVLMAGVHHGDRPRFEDCLRAAASLIIAALNEGQHVEWINLANRNRQLIPAFADGTDMLDAIARIPAIPGNLAPEDLDQAYQKISPRGALALVLLDCPPAILEKCAQWSRAGRRVSLYLPLGNTAAIEGLPIYYYSQNEVIQAAS